MKDWKTTMTPIATLLVAGCAKYGFDVPEELILAILALGWLIFGYFTRDKKGKALIVMGVIAMMFIAPAAYADSVTLAWDASDAATGYKLYYGTKSGAPYENSVDVGNVLTYSLELPSLLEKVKNVRPVMVTTTKPASVLIAWDSVPNAQSYKVLWQAPEGASGGTASVEASNTQLLIPNLANDTTYTITVKAFNSNAPTYYFAATAYDGYTESDYSEEVSYRMVESEPSDPITIKTLKAPELVITTTR